MAETRSVRIGVAQVQALQPGEILRDTEVKGFGVRRRADAMSYFLQTRVKGRLRWFTIGKHGAPWTPAAARKEALRLLATVSQGQDPGADKQRALRTRTLADAAQLFLSQHGPRLAPRTRQEYARAFSKIILPAFGVRRIDDLKRSDVTRFHTAMQDTPRMANLALAILSKLMTWLEQHGDLPEHSNPCRLVARFKENHRERYLTREELDRLGVALAEAEAAGDNPYVIAAIRLLILTGARLTEILTLRWDFIDFERSMIFLPASKTGAKPIFLNEGAIEVLRAIPRIEGNPFVIVGALAGSHLINLQKPWQRLRTRAGLADVRLHDLRHSFASFAAAQGASLLMIGKLLGHTQAQTTQRYAHLVADPVRNVAENVGNQLASSLAPRSTK